MTTARSPGPTTTVLPPIVPLALIVGVSPFATDMYIPALPAIARDLGTTPGAVQLSLTAFLVAFAVGQLLVGPVSDGIGRRPMLVVGTALFALASVGCAIAPDVVKLVVARVAQGLAGAAGAVAGGRRGAGDGDAAKPVPHLRVGAGRLLVARRTDLRRPTEMDIVVHEAETDTAVLECSGRLNMVSAPTFRETVAQIVGNGRSRLVVELSGVEFMDSSGLGALVGSLKTARQAGGDLRIAAPSEQVQMVLKLSNIDKILRTYPDGDAAVTDW